MAKVHVNASSYRLSVAVYQALTIATAGTPAWSDFSGIAMTFVDQVTGLNITADNRTKDISALGDGGWTRSVRERLGVSMALTIEHLVDDGTTPADADKLEAGHKIIADASQKIGNAGLILARFEHPKAAARAQAANNNVPDDGRVSVGAFSVEGGNHGLGGGGTNASFVVSQYNLMSYGPVYTVDI